MSDSQDGRGTGGPEPRDRDPWAPPEHGAPGAAVPGGAQGGVPLGKSWDAPQPAPVHDQPTVAAMPAASPTPDAGAVPPPPTAPGGPAAGGYGYPTAGTANTPYGSGAYPAYPATGYQSYGQPGWQPSPSNGMGITAMVLGILSVCLFCLYGVVGLILGLLALIFGILGRKKAQRGEATNGGMALAGIILGSIGMLLGAVVIGLLAWGITTAINEERDRVEYEYDYDSYSNVLVVDERAGR
ncbi:DUF4190 domain-containing protein [Streptomyces sp. HNM0663]|uniref:DUF4190 domain-containing protein n=1 Tax=Streptomyces chengmaiensis TaxID=3040919 RepID=A0ABT6HSJ0_9ACTN|nr:DUF4190 domain-containing protein [Streptomyces chengmaiensis]MDH2391330.1 DUF4190 domain-containing protein [Streptomyces chengmaiensis]